MHNTNIKNEKASAPTKVADAFNNTNDFDLPTGQRGGKAFATLAARFALAGHALTRSNPADGAVMYYAGRWGLHRALPDLEAAARFLMQIGGGNV